mmetsp:Transcript_30847/g.94880  ORF Transcript_30847/g.94880 Transcript_30847/m.94880 type:complete len:242 (-) Transcript_30847:761-1486(-)
MTRSRSMFPTAAVLATKTPVRMFSTPKMTNTTKTVKPSPYQGLISTKGAAYSPQLRPPEMACVREKMARARLPKSSVSSSIASADTPWLDVCKWLLAPCNSITEKMYITVSSSTKAQDRETMHEIIDAAISLKGRNKWNMRMTRNTRTARTTRMARRKARFMSRKSRTCMKLAATTNVSKRFQNLAGPRKNQHFSAIMRKNSSRANAVVNDRSTAQIQARGPSLFTALRMSMSLVTPMTTV